MKNTTGWSVRWSPLASLRISTCLPLYLPSLRVPGPGLHKSCLVCHNIRTTAYIWTEALVDNFVGYPSHSSTHLKLQTDLYEWRRRELSSGANGDGGLWRRVLRNSRVYYSSVFAFGARLWLSTPPSYHSLGLYKGDLYISWSRPQHSISQTKPK